MKKNNFINSIFRNKSFALSVCIFITLLVMVIELIVSYSASSLMLYSDGLHMLSHALALGVSLLAIYLSKRRNSSKTELYAAMINGIGLIFFTIVIVKDAVYKMYVPEEIVVQETILVAIIGLLVNLITARILFVSGLEDLNMKSAFLHMLADTFSSVSIIIGAIVIHYTDYFIIDSILSLIIAVVIAKWAIGLIFSSMILLKSIKQSNENAVEVLK